MDVKYILHALENPASEVSIQNLEKQSPFKLPDSYLWLLRQSNGGDAFYSLPTPGYFALWPAEEVIQLNADYEIQKWLSFLFCFGSDGGGEAIALDYREDNVSVVRVPFGDLVEESIKEIAPSFENFLEILSYSNS